jgi:O-succinylbenzoate synthase
MEYKKIAKLVVSLHQKTIDGKLNWEQTDKRGIFQLSLPNYAIRFWMRSKGEQAADYIISIYDSEGNLVEQASDVDLKNDLSKSYEIMKGMYELARRKAMGVDKALDDIISQLEEDLPF